MENKKCLIKLTRMEKVEESVRNFVCKISSTVWWLKLEQLKLVVNVNVLRILFKTEKGEK